ncbi:MAG: DUF3106 domain-containing protein [Pseudomonadota bacterium]|nr:DUF3106 domain-containing protein [Pseudomonadota bacterium]
MPLRLIQSARRRWLLFCTLATAALAAVAVTPPATVSAPAASAPAITSAAAKSTPTKPVAKAEVHPFWNELSPVQQAALVPLATDWHDIDAFRKKKWIVIASRYPAMKPEEQQRLHERMRAWAKLSPDERRVAREIYTRTKKLDHDQKSAQWQEYQQLPDAEKQRLAADINAHKRVANLPSPAAVKAPLAARPTELPVTGKPATMHSPIAPVTPAVGAPAVAPTPVAPEPAPVAPVAQPQVIPMIN